LVRIQEDTETSQTRRQFLVGVGELAAASLVAGRALGRMFEPTLSGSINPHLAMNPAPAQIRFAYAAITWGGNDVQAIKDISEVGFRGIQLRTSVLRDFGDKPKALRALLAAHRLQMVAFSSGGVGIAPGSRTDEIARHIKNATFVRDAGGLYLQLTDSARPKGQPPVPEDYKLLGSVLTEIGKRSIDLGIPVAYHNHMNSLGEAPQEVDWIMDATDPKYVKLELDIAHYVQGGGDPVTAVQKYRGRHLFLHIKDVQSPLPESPANDPRSYRFVELGRGKVDLSGVFAALKAIEFRGWCVVEFDSVYDKARTPKESALISKAYIEQRLKLKI
jgi:inosose dehydratase